MFPHLQWQPAPRCQKAQWYVFESDCSFCVYFNLAQGSVWFSGSVALRLEGVYVILIETRVYVATVVLCKITFVPVQNVVIDTCMLTYIQASQNEYYNLK